MKKNISFSFCRIRFLLFYLVSYIFMLLIAVVLNLHFEYAFAEEVKAVDVAVIYSDNENSSQFLDGVKLGVEEVNRAGGLVGAPLNLQLIEEENYSENSNLQEIVSDSLKLAKRVSSDDGVVAVIGHSSSSTAVPAGSIYDQNEKLFISTHATATSLNNHGYNYVFSLQPNNSDNAALMADYALAQGFKRFVVLSDDTSYGVETTDRFSSFVAQNGADILYHGGLSSHGRPLDSLLMFLLDNAVFEPGDIDAIFITTSSYAEAANFIKRARTLNLRMPILGPEILYSQSIEETAGLDSMQGVAAVSLYDRDSETEKSKVFAEAFERKTGQKPFYQAALGYDAIKLLAFAAEQAGTYENSTLANTLRIMRYQERYVGAAGEFAFDIDGLITDIQVYIVRHNGDAFYTVEKSRINRHWKNEREPTLSQ